MVTLPADKDRVVMAILVKPPQRPTNHRANRVRVNMGLLLRNMLNRASLIRKIQVVTVRLTATPQILGRVAMEVRLQVYMDHQIPIRKAILDSTINQVLGCRAHRLILHQEAMVNQQTLSQDLHQVNMVPRLPTRRLMASKPVHTQHITRILITMRTRGQTNNTNTLLHRPRTLRTWASKVDMALTIPRQPYPPLLGNINISNHRAAPAFLGNKGATVMQIKVDKTMDNRRRRRLRKAVMGSKVGMVTLVLHPPLDGELRV